MKAQRLTGNSPYNIEYTSQMKQINSEFYADFRHKSKDDFLLKIKENHQNLVRMLSAKKRDYTTRVENADT